MAAIARYSIERDYRVLLELERCLRLVTIQQGNEGRIVAIVGPTAAGKSRLAMALATQFCGEIVTADSRQVYRYMDIGTDKPSASERARVPHYMLDLAAPDETYSAQRFASEAGNVLRRLGESETLAIVAGGTGFYLQALLDRVSFPRIEPNEALRAELRHEAETLGSQALHDRLVRVDPSSGDRIHPHNVPRVIRALEIVEATGRPVPAVPAREPLPALHLGLDAELSALDHRADARVLEQIEAGLLEETRLLLAMGYDACSPGLQGFGYRQMVAHLAGEISLTEAIADYQRATRQYIRRQLTWFRRDARVRWIRIERDSTEVAAEMVWRWIGGS